MAFLHHKRQCSTVSKQLASGQCSSSSPELTAMTQVNGKG